MFPWVFACLEEVSSSRNEFIANSVRIACGGTGEKAREEPEEIVTHEIERHAPTFQHHSASTHDILSNPLMGVCDQAVCLISRDGIIRYLSSNWSERLHFTLPPGVGFSAIVTPSQRLQYENHITGAPLLSEPGHSQKEIRLQLGDSEKNNRWYGVRMFAVGEAGNLQGHFILLRDIEEEVKRENELKKAQIKAELALKSRSEFLGHMSHELRTPLNAILGFAEMMERGVLGEIHNMAYKGYIGNIRESGQELLHKINDLIAISNIETGDIVTDEGEFSADELIAYVMELHAHKAFSKDVSIETGDSAKNIFIQGNRTLLAKAFANIVLNAVTHSSVGKSVTIRTHVTHDGEFSLTVSDHGCGIERERLATLRKMLRSDHGFSLGSPEGRQIGLGLAIAKEYVGMHDGKIVIDSTKGEGTIVKIMLPAERTRQRTLRIAARQKDKVAAG